MSAHRAKSERIGDLYQERTRYSRDSMDGAGPDFSIRPETYKRYESAPRTALPPPSLPGAADLWELLAARRSVRSYKDEPLGLDQLSQLLWASQGITAQAGSHELRTAPSAGALYPVETYLVVNSVRDLEPGVYHYHIPDHALERIRAGDYSKQAARAALDQGMAGRAGVLFIWTGIVARCAWKYGQRGFRYIYAEAGHIAQNLALAAVALGLGSCQIGAFFDDETEALLGVDGRDEVALYMTSVGVPRR